MRSESLDHLLLLNHLGWVHTIIYLILINAIIGIGIYRYWRVFHSSTSFNVYQPIEDSTSRTTNPVGFGSILYTAGLGIIFILAELLAIAVDAILYSNWLSTPYTITLLLELFLLGSIIGYFVLELEVLGTISHAWAGYWVGFLAAPAQGLMAWRWARVILTGKIATLDSFEGFICFLFFLRLLTNSIFSRYCLNWLQLNNYSWKFSQLSTYQDLESAETPAATKKTGLSDLYYRVKKVFKFMWPENDKRLQRLIYLSYVLMITSILVSSMIPFVNKLVINALDKSKVSDPETSQNYIWYLVTFFFGLKLFQGTNGLFKCAQSYVLIPINQHTQRYLSTHTFNHVHHLSLDFHIKKKSGELVKIIDRGVQSIGFLNNYIVFQLLPIFLEIGVSAVVVFFTMNYIYSAIISFTMLFYAWATIAITEWRTKFRKSMIEKENRMSSIVIDSLTNFETVKYFNGEKYELERLRQATLSYQQDEFKTNVSLSVLNLAQNFILVTGQLIGSLLVVYQISQKQADVGDFVMFQAYFLNLAAPLNFFGTFYRIIQQSAIDMDKLVNLLDQKPSVKEDPASAPLIPGPGEIVFDNVTFGYQPGVPTLKNVSFKAFPGQRIALVGPTGSGKSSILRCLLRFYDIESGAIYVNGQDISKTTLSSLRKAIGVVPQDMVLFNDTIRYNIRYGDPEASLEQMEDAAKRSKIHDRILSFPEGYDTLVGERGLRLSGGEKQRVAIARTILKNPSIVLLDEATSALDVSTEKEIQSSLHSVTTGRTSISVAHRLTTIMNSDMILYIQDGNVMEQGTHEELLSKENGLYRAMWFKQLEEQSNSRTDSPAEK